MKIYEAKTEACAEIINSQWLEKTKRSSLNDVEEAFMH